MIIVHELNIVFNYDILLVFYIQNKISRTCYTISITSNKIKNVHTFYIF